MMSTNSQCSFSPLMTSSLSLTTPIMCTYHPKRKCYLNFPF